MQDIIKTGSMPGNSWYNAGIVVDKQDNLYVSDFSNSAILKITPARVVSNYEDRPD
jgi:hypothetical protein